MTEFGMHRIGAARRMVAGAAAAALLTVSLAAGVSADVVATGNGGDSLATASGGPITIGAVESGESTGSVVGVGTLGDDIAAAVLAAFGGEEDVEMTEETESTETAGEVVVE